MPWTHQNDSLSKDPHVWYTASKADKGATVYAIVLGWPMDDMVHLGSVKVISIKIVFKLFFAHSI